MKLETQPRGTNPASTKVRARRTIVVASHVEPDVKNIVGVANMMEVVCATNVLQGARVQMVVYQKPVNAC
jgi:hypothetical protein|tara:strand:- start:1870 stop:2079 length:210 start_codon:yes stop_codon:yes gene_type:complete